MTQQVINIGAAEDDGTGDHLRVAFDKSNDNFTELYAADATLQPLDADLTAIAALTGTDTIYYRSGTDVWSPVEIGAGLEFTSGNLSAIGTAGAVMGYVFSTATTAPPSSGHIRLNNATQSSATLFWINNFTDGGIDVKRIIGSIAIGAKLVVQAQDDSSKYLEFEVSSALVDGNAYWEIPVVFLRGGSALGNNDRVMFAIGQSASWASIDSPTFTGDPRAPTPAIADNDTSIATTAFVKAQNYITSSALAPYAPLASPALSGNPTAPTPTAGDNDTSVATTAFVTTAVAGKADTSALASYALLASPVFTGDPRAPTPATADNDTSIATTAYVQAQGYLTSAAATAAYQPLDADLTAIAALTGTNTIYYRSATNTWAAVNVSTGLSFSGGNLTATGGGGDVFKAAANAFTNLNTFLGGSSGVIIGHTASTGIGDLEIHGVGHSPSLEMAAWVNTTTGPYIYLNKSRGTTVGSNTVVAAGDELGAIFFQGSTGSNIVPGASIKGIATSTPAAGYVPGAIQLSILNAAGANILCGSISPLVCNFIGETAGGSGAPAGYVGEYLTASGAANTALNSGAYSAVASLSIPAGDWDVRGVVRVNGPAGSYMYCNVYTLSASTSGSANDTQTGIFTGLGDCWTAVGPFRVSRSSTATYWLNIYVATAGCIAVTSEIQARRRH